MPARPWRIPLPPTRLNHSDSPSSPSSPLSPPPPSPRSPNHSHLTPPPRLHLRTLIPSPPLPAEYLKTAPGPPYPWIWRCHLCGSIYRLGATRRCLEDGHYFCSLPTPPPSPIVPSSEDFFATTSQSGQEIIADLAANKKRSRSKRKKAPRGCRSEFDYAGWSKYNIWRREIAVLKKDQKRRWLLRILMKGAADRVEANGMVERSWKGRDCWRDCDFPSECHNERKAEREWEKQMKQIRESEEKWARENSWNGEVEMSETPEKDVVAQSIERDGVEKIFPADLPEELVIGGIENLGPLGTDSDGLGEQSIQADYVPKRRKSLDAAMNPDSPPSSPLTRECNFGFEDPLSGCQIWSSAGLCACAGKAEECETDKDGDIQMKEVAMAKSPFLRYLEKDTADESFGDEDMGEF